MSISSGSDTSSDSSNGRSPDRPIVLKPIGRRGDDQCGSLASGLCSFTGFLLSSTATLPRHKVQMYGLDDFNDPFYDEPTDDAPLASPSPDGTAVQQQNRPSRSLRLILVGLALVVLAWALTIRPPSYGALELEFKVSTGAAIDPICGRAGYETASSTSIVIPDGLSAAETVTQIVGDALAWAIALLQQLGWWGEYLQLNGTTKPPSAAVTSPGNEPNAPPGVLVVELSARTGRFKGGLQVIDLELSVSFVDPVWTSIAHHVPGWLRAITGIKVEPPKTVAVRLLGLDPEPGTVPAVDDGNGSQRCCATADLGHADQTPTPGLTDASKTATPEYTQATPTPTPTPTPAPAPAPTAIATVGTAASVLRAQAVEQLLHPPDPGGHCPAVAANSTRYVPLPPTLLQTPNLIADMPLHEEADPRPAGPEPPVAEAADQVSDTDPSSPEELRRATVSPSAGPPHRVPAMFAGLRTGLSANKGVCPLDTGPDPAGYRYADADGEGIHRTTTTTTPTTTTVLDSVLPAQEGRHFDRLAIGRTVPFGIMVLLFANEVVLLKDL